MAFGTQVENQDWSFIAEELCACLTAAEPAVTFICHSNQKYGTLRVVWSRSALLVLPGKKSVPEVPCRSLRTAPICLVYWNSFFCVHFFRSWLMIVVAEGRIVVECFLDLLHNLIIDLSLLSHFLFSLLSQKLVLLLPFIIPPTALSSLLRANYFCRPIRDV